MTDILKTPNFIGRLEKVAGERFRPAVPGAVTVELGGPDPRIQMAVDATVASSWYGSTSGMPGLMNLRIGK